STSPGSGTWSPRPRTLPWSAGGSCGRRFPTGSRFVSASGKPRGTMSTMKATDGGAKPPARPDRSNVTRAGGPEPHLEPFADKVRDILAALGEDPAREGLAKTPERVESSLRFLTQGYHVSVADAIGEAVFAETHQSMIMVRDIELYSLCEHHLLPFFGRAHVAYIPDGKILGLSKVARVVDVFARRLQVQERLTDQIADAIMDVL